MLFEFYVTGTPVSSQTSNRASLSAWKGRVRRAVEARWRDNHPPLTGPVEVNIVYYYDGGHADADNLPKPILDAMIGIVFADDWQISDSIVKLRDVNGKIRVRGMSPVLAEAFCTAEEFIYVRVSPASGLEDQP